MPLRLFRLRSVAVSNVIGVLWAAAMFAWFFISALYMQLVLGYDPMQIGLAFLPANLIMAAFSIGLSAKLVMRYGIRPPIIAGMLLAAAGLALFAAAPVGGSFVAHVLPGMLLLGLGCGLALNPVMLAAMSDVAPSESGLASGVVNTSFMMGGALGLARPRQPGRRAHRDTRRYVGPAGGARRRLSPRLCARRAVRGGRRRARRSSAAGQRGRSAAGRSQGVKLSA